MMMQKLKEKECRKEDHTTPITPPFLLEQTTPPKEMLLALYQ
jgi:hypothetical protein